MNKITKVMAFALAFGTIAAISNAATIALDTTPEPPNYANQKWAGSLGIDFHVNFVAGQMVVVSKLGIFDDFQNGFINPAAISIYQLGGTNPLITTVLVPTGAGGTLMGGSRYFDVAPVTLIAGNSYTIVADYNTNLPDGGTGAVINPATPADQNYNTSGAANGNVTANTNGSLIQFIGLGRADGHGHVPTFQDTGPALRYNAGSFVYDIVPEPSSIAMLAGLAVTGAGFAFRLRRRSKK